MISSQEGVFYMQRKQQSKRIAKQHAKSNKNTPLNRFLIWVGGILLLLGIVAGILWGIFGVNNDKTKLIANAYAPTVATFSDNNTMFFATSHSIPEPNNARDITNPDSVIIAYTVKSGNYAPAFKSNIDNADLSKQIKITPFIRGTWNMRGNDTLVFTPESHWPANTKFTVKIDSDLFNNDVTPDKTRISFTTPDIVASIDNFNLYTNPDAKKSVIGVAVISFNYEIDTTDFSDKVSMKLDDKKLDFSVKFDKFRRTAFITSAPTEITDAPQIMRLKLNRVPARSGDGRTEKLTANITVESADNIFKIASVETVVATNNDGNAQQLILLNTTTAAHNGTNWSQHINAYLLPEYRDDDERENNTPHIWKNDEITSDVISKSEKLNLSAIDLTAPNGVYQYAFAYSVSEKTPRYIYVDITPGITSANDFTMQNGIKTVLRVPYPEQSVTIAGDGALLSLAGNRELGIVARGGADTAYINLYKVKSSEINHLISQTYNVFANAMEFKSWNFGVYDMSVVFQKQISFVNPSATRANYASIDLGDYLDRTYGDNTGIFIIQTGTSESASEFNDKRLILLTDLGIIRKVNMDGSSVVFISNLGAGTPASDVEISVLGRNGNAVWMGRTDSDGRADIPNLPWSEYKNAREPVAIVARRGNDVSFIPYNAYNQRVEYSKFNIDGTYSTTAVPMNAFVFSDRGIYRPGENLIVGGIVKNKSFKSLAGIPVKMQIRDSRGRLVLERTFSLTSDGMFDIQYEIPNDAALGGWTAYLYSLTSNDKLDDMLGMTSFDIQEFTPDTMKISAKIASASDNGWISPDNLSANVSLRNLFGTPAANRKISATATLTPVEFTFDKYPEYKFTPNFISDTGLSENTVRRAQTFSTTIPDVFTDINGAAKFDIKFDTNIPNGTYKLALNVRGFEQNSGINVQTNITTNVSNAKYLIGWHTTNDLSYINRNAKRNIKLISIDHTSTPMATDGLTMRIIRREKQTSLIKDYNNMYKYQTVSKDKIISQSQINIPVNGTELTLNTTNGGSYILQILDSSDRILANIEYFVAGQTNETLSSDTNAELAIKLDKSEYIPGEEITINITAPYTGTGLITIERDKVYAYKWFTSTSTTSVQKIKLPSGFEGTGYINVSFVRDINSRDIFTTPYAYAVAPFSADTSARNIKIKLNAPDIVSDGKLNVEYITNKDAKLMIFAVNTGILQVAKYQIPNPLAHFFQKSALQVDTFQILSLLLPEYNILREYAKTGGGDYGVDGAIEQIVNNPFGRATLPPVAFYSGIIDAHANTPSNIQFEIPEYFNGELQIFAVAANTSAIGSADTKTLVQSPIIISTSAPSAVAPGDIFDINTVITNMTSDNADISVMSDTTDGIEITSAQTARAPIATNAEKLFTFTARATNALGNATVSFNATASDISRRATTAISVRPATTFNTYIKSDLIDSEITKISDFEIDLYPEYATRRLYISRGAAAYILPLFEYLANYEYPCTEQIVSRAIPYAVMPNNEIFGTTFDNATTKITTAINTLRNRQNDDGSFALWSGGATPRANQSNTDSAYLTSYVVQFLTIAKNAGFPVPGDMLSRGIDYLRTFAGGTITDAAYARAVAYAIYVISSNDFVTTSYIDAFTQYANENIPDWESDLMGTYIAASYKILQQEDLARNLIAKYKESTNSDFEYSDLFNNNVANDAMYYYILNKYFSSQNPMQSTSIRKYIESGMYSAYTSAIVIMGMSGNNNAPISSVTITTDTDATPIVKTTQSGVIAEIPSNATSLEINCANCSDSDTAYYTLLQQGYPTSPNPASNGIEIIREYYNADGDKITSANLGDIITVKIFARTRGGVDIADNVVITDLLPGGFIPTPESATGNMEFIEMREDRVLIYTDLTRSEQTFTYNVQIGAGGKFIVPAITAQSMYNPSINATDKPGIFTVLNETPNH